MDNPTTIRRVFRRNRQPGDLVFAVFFLLFSLFLLSQLGNQTQWIKGTKLFAQPSFWPTVSLGVMSFFAIFHFLGSILSPRITGRLEELSFWIKSLEYAGWFMLYVWVVPVIGYLPATIILMVLLTLRVGYREKRLLLGALVVAIAIVVIFKGFLSVKIPGGQLYELLPAGLRNFMLLYL